MIWELNLEYKDGTDESVTYNTNKDDNPIPKIDEHIEFSDGSRVFKVFDVSHEFENDDDKKTLTFKRVNVIAREI